MSNFKMYSILLALVGAGFFSGYQCGQVAHMLGGLSARMLSFVAIAAAVFAIGASMLFGAFSFVHEIESASIVKHEDGTPFTVTLVVGPWSWTRAIPTEVK